jgi:hypothetical protein
LISALKSLPLLGGIFFELAELLQLQLE